MLETILTILAGCGLLAIIIGRHMMIRDTGGDLPFLWMIALRLVPFSDLVYMVRHFAQAKKGGLIAIAGMWLMVPYAGHQLWERQSHFKEQIEEMRGKVADSAEAGADEDEASEVAAEMSAEGAVAMMHSNTRRLMEKEKLVAQLNARIAWWHDQLQQRRAALAADDLVAVADFNAEAAAYASLNAIAKEKTAELMKLRSLAKR